MKENEIQKLEETRVVKTQEGREIEVKFVHDPNVGRRSIYNGMPIWTGQTTAEANGIKVDAKCWAKEPFTYSRARVVTAGRLLKKMGLPTDLAEQVKD